MNTTITLKEYLNKGKTFVIPDYQRGYVWSKSKTGADDDSVTNLMSDLIKRYKNNMTVFLQGFTVTEGENTIELIDGQQRTTFLYLLLTVLGFTGRFEIRYDIRNESGIFLKKLTTQNVNQYFESMPDKQKEEIQDIFFFKKSLFLINKQLEDSKISKSDFGSFLNFLLKNVKFLYIDIDVEYAKNVFTMMNGSKAEMLTEEIVKAELLRLASLGKKGQTMQEEWENQFLRSRYAREWDKWLHWWNIDDVRMIFRTNRLMGLLLISTWKDGNNKGEYSYEAYKNKFLAKEISKEAKDLFDKLRRLQKHFEDAYYNPISRNQIGAILRLMDKESQDAFIREYFINRKINLDYYYRCVFLEMTHKEIIEYNSEKLQTKFNSMLQRISNDLLYDSNDKEIAFRLLLKINIDEDNKQNGGKGRNFDFAIWDNGVRSLEHIFPKSRISHECIEQTENGERKYLLGGDNKIHNESDYYWNKRSDIHKENGEGLTTEHSIGNLALLYLNDNSQFSNNSFEEKKNNFFNKDVNEYFKSRHLLHTIYLFAKSKWSVSDIAENKENIIKDFKNYYKDIIANNYEQD